MMKPPLHTFITKQATLDGKRFRSTWPVFDFSVVSPHPSRLTACHLPRGGRRPPGGGAFIGARLSISGVPSTPGPGYTRPGLRPVHPLQAGEGRNPSSVTPYGVPPSPWGKATSRRGKAQRAFSGPCVFWHCMVQCPKIGKRQVERGAFSVQSQDPAGHYGVLCEAPEPVAPG